MIAGYSTGENNQAEANAISSPSIKVGFFGDSDNPVSILDFESALC